MVLMAIRDALYRPEGRNEEVIRFMLWKLLRVCCLLHLVHQICSKYCFSRPPPSASLSPGPDVCAQFTAIWRLLKQILQLCKVKYHEFYTFNKTQIFTKKAYENQEPAASVCWTTFSSSTLNPTLSYQLPLLGLPIQDFILLKDYLIDLVWISYPLFD